ncbi:MAG TPA: TonB-dependent receptor [Holophagaceae bacterium]|nr:TonB-dependent receptor [Holophagaceae bacterium]
MNRVLSRLGLTAVSLVAGSALYAQGTQTASVTGRIVDAQGNAVAGASVRLSSPSLQLARTLVTGADGTFVTRLLPPGFYTIEITKDGFQTAKFTQQLGIDQNYQPKVVMQTVATETVQIVATANPLVDKTDVKSAANYQLADVDKLPSGRAVETVALLTPGVTSGVGGRVQVRGAMTSGNLYLVDGQDVADNAYNTRGVQLIDDAVEEVQVLTGAISAEYGDVDGGVINAVTKSGSNEFHGQLRWSLSNSAWNALVPYQDPASVQNKLNEIKTVSLGGYFWKDRIWFFASYYNTSSTGNGAISSNSEAGPGGAGSNYVTTNDEIRRDFKLTFALTENQSIVMSYANSQNAQGNRNYSAGELAALVPQTNTSEFWNVDWRGIWTSAFSTDVRYGEKKQKLSAGSPVPGLSPIYDDDNGLFFQNGIFNSNDGGDNRNNKTFAAKGSLFLDWQGQHQIDFGVQYIKGISKSRNDQSVTGRIIEVGNPDQNNNLSPYYLMPSIDIVNRTGFGEAIWTFQSSDGQATNESYGLFANDKWSINEHFTAQIGLRFDKYKATDDRGNRSAGANGFSPRLGVKYDIFGDSKWLIGASWSRYNGKVLDTIVNQVTNQGNPTEIDYAWVGAAGPQPYSALEDLTNYDFSPAGVLYYNNPALNVKLASDLKAPHTDEAQLSAAYSFNFDWLGQGFVSLTAVQRDWKDLIDYRVGNDGTVTDPSGNVIYVKTWYNSPIAERKYKGLEFAAQLIRGPWSLNGGITWSSLKGNYEGEGSSTPGRGEGLEYFTTQNGVAMYDHNITTPYGYLTGHKPIRMRWEADRSVHSIFGDTTFGFIYRFDSGSHYSDTRSVPRAALNAGLSSQFGSTATQYRDNTRGQYVFPAVSTVDMAITHNWELFKVRSTPVNAFVKLAIFNLFNHQQITSFNTQSYNAGSLTSPWVRRTAPPSPIGYGDIQNANNWGGPGFARSYQIDMGIRF